MKGILYRGDPKTKYDQSNTPYMQKYYSARAEELAMVGNLPNEEESSQFMLKVLDFDEANRTPMPDVTSPSELG